MKFSMSEAWRDATAMMGANREVLIVVAGIFFLLPGLGQALLIPDLQQTLMADPEQAQAMLTDLLVNWGWMLALVGLGVALAQIVGYLAMLALLRDSSRPTVGQALQTGLVGLLPAIGYYILLIVAFVIVLFLVIALVAVSPALAVIVGLAVGVVAIYVMIKLSLVLAVIAIDRIGNPITAMSRSWALTKGNSFRLFLFFLLLGIVYIVIATVIGAIFGALGVALGSSTALLVNGIVSAILSTIVTVIFVAVIAATHRQLSGPSSAAVSETFE